MKFYRMVVTKKGEGLTAESLDTLDRTNKHLRRYMETLGADETPWKRTHRVVIESYEFNSEDDFVESNNRVYPAGNDDSDPCIPDTVDVIYDGDMSLFYQIDLVKYDDLGTEIECSSTDWESYWAARDKVDALTNAMTKDELKRVGVYAYCRIARSAEDMKPELKGINWFDCDDEFERIHTPEFMF